MQFEGDAHGGEDEGDGVVAAGRNGWRREVVRSFNGGDGVAAFVQARWMECFVAGAVRCCSRWWLRGEDGVLV